MPTSPQHPCNHPGVDHNGIDKLLDAYIGLYFRGSHVPESTFLYNKRSRVRRVEIVKFYFGLDDNQPKTLKETGAKYGLSSERIRQIIQRTCKDLSHPRYRKIMADE